MDTSSQAIQSSQSQNIRQENRLQSSPLQSVRLSFKNTYQYLIAFALVAIIFISYHYNRNSAQEQAQLNKQQIIEGALIYNSSLQCDYSFIFQKADHFAPENQEDYWMQRVLVDNKAAQGNVVPPVFVQININGPAMQVQTSQFIKTKVKQVKGILIRIQTRFFGLSLPFGQDSFSLHIMKKHLTTAQMIQDIVWIINRIRDLGFFGVSSDSPWILNAEGISSTVSIRLQNAYPDLLVGNLASNPTNMAVLKPLINVNAYLKYASAGTYCLSAMKNILKEILKQFQQNESPSILKQYSQGNNLTKLQMLLAIQTQVPALFNRFLLINICNQGASLLMGQQFDVKAQIKRQLFSRNPIGYSKAAMTNELLWKKKEQVRFSRAVQYLRCSQTGSFLSYPRQKSFAFQQLDQEFYKQRCFQIFGQNIWPQQKQQQNFDKVRNLLVIRPSYSIKKGYETVIQPNKQRKISEIIGKCSFCEDQFEYTAWDALLQQIQIVKKQMDKIVDSWIKK